MSNEPNHFVLPNPFFYETRFIFGATNRPLFESFELSLVEEDENGTCTPVMDNSVQEGAKLFWSIYGHYSPESGRQGVEHLCDYDDYQHAKHILRCLGVDTTNLP